MTKKIINQKEVAKKVFESLTKVDPNCILAGGAPRDWYFRKEAKDLDFYFCSSASKIGEVLNQLKMCGIPDNVHHNHCHHFDEENSIYSRMDGIQRIYNVYIEEQKVQLIMMRSCRDRWNCVHEMDVSICQIYCNNSLKLYRDRNFILTELSGIMFLNEGKDNPPKWTDYHPNKMVKRFGDKFKPGTKQDAMIGSSEGILRLSEYEVKEGRSYFSRKTIEI